MGARDRLKRSATYLKDNNRLVRRTENRDHGRSSRGDALERRTVFMFSGQGSQYFQMGRGLYERNATFRGALERLDELAVELVGQSVVGALYHEGRSRAETFDRLALTSPAIFMVEYALARALIDAHVKPDLVLGMSSGSFAAAVTAGALSAETALAAIVAQTSLIERHCRRGAMIAVLGDVQLYRDPVMQQCCEIAAVNTSSHFVVSAPADCVARLADFLRWKGVTFQPMPVSFAFHSRWIEAAAPHAQAHFRSLALEPPKIPLVCCACGAILTTLPRDYFWQVTRQPILFPQAVLSAEGAGANEYIDVGPSGTLAALLKHVLPADSRSTLRQILSPFGREWENFQNLLA
jgi:acyl transferase domain-containing protein